MKKRFFVRLLWVLPFFLFIAAINYFVDPANIFHPAYEVGIAEYLAKGYNVTNVVNYDERKLQRLTIQQLTTCPTDIVLGSSKVMEIDASMAKCASFVNSGVSGASLEDDIAIYSLYDLKGCDIKKVIIGIDPWLLNDNNEQLRWKAYSQEYYSFLQKLTGEKPPTQSVLNNLNLDKVGELLSFSYFRSSVSFLTGRQSKKYVPTHEAVNDGFTRLTDGSISYGKAYRNATPATVEADAAAIIANDPIYSLGNFNALSPRLKLSFEKFISYLLNKNTEVEFFFCPFHPLVYKHIKNSAKYRMVFEAELYFRQFAKVHGIMVRGAYDPQDYALTSSDFWDGLHCNKITIGRILNGTTNPAK